MKKHTVSNQRDKHLLNLVHKYIAGTLSYSDIRKKYGRGVWHCMGTALLRALKNNKLKIK